MGNAVTFYHYYLYRSPFRTGQQGNSRLCKGGFLFRFRELAQIARAPHLQMMGSYNEAKATAQFYQQAQQIFKQDLAANKHGQWLQKPREVDLFIK